MRVVVDARQIYRPERRGIGKTMLQLYQVLSRIRPHWQFRLVHQLPCHVPEFADCPNLQPFRIDCHGSNRLNFWDNVLLPLTALALRGDVLHCPANVAPAFNFVPLALHLHDLIPLDLAANPAEASSWVRQIRRATRQAREILTGSEYSRQRIAQALGLTPERITVHPWAPDPRMQATISAEQRQKVLPRYGLAPDEAYLFAFGANDPRKNTRRILEVYSRLPSEIQARGRLLIVGLQEPALGDFKAQASEGSLSRAILLHGFAPEEDLPVLLGSALGLIYASSYEGFGLPVLDAFACGTPVLAGNRTSIPEVAGQAAQLFDPQDEAALQGFLERLLTDAAWRAELRARGQERIKQYSWEAAAETVALAFEHCLRRAPR